jgi:hypothetical protein
VPGVDDEALLRMLREVEEQEDLADGAGAEPPAEEPPPEVCPSCGSPAETLGECHLCGEPGCLPRDAWTPGAPDPCLTLCVRCARTIHLACAAEDEAGNPRCATCAF